MKRFWKTAIVQPLAETYTVQLDSRPVKLPSGAPLTLPFRALAEGIAAEWDAAPATFTPDDLPLTRLASTAQERIPAHRDNIVSQLAAYGLNDLLCYRAELPQPLIERQHAQWTPWLSWLNDVHDIGLITTSGLMPVSQLPWTGEKLTALLAPRSDYTLTTLGVLIPALGSFVLGLAVVDGALPPEEAADLALLDELWQAEQWGEDNEATIRRTRLREDVLVSARFLTLCA